MKNIPRWTIRLWNWLNTPSHPQDHKPFYVYFADGKIRCKVCHREP